MIALHFQFKLQPTPNHEFFRMIYDCKLETWLLFFLVGSPGRTNKECINAHPNAFGSNFEGPERIFKKLSSTKKKKWDLPKSSFHFQFYSSSSSSLNSSSFSLLNKRRGQGVGPKVLKLAGETKRERERIHIFLALSFPFFFFIPKTSILKESFSGGLE